MNIVLFLLALVLQPKLQDKNLTLHFVTHGIYINSVAELILLWGATLHNHNCYIAGIFFPNSAHSHCLLRGHVTSNNKHRKIYQKNISGYLINRMVFTIFPLKEKSITVFKIKFTVWELKT